MAKLEADYHIGGGWGDSIQWLNPEIFNKSFDENTKISVVGWKNIKPQVGQTLLGEFNNSFILFKFISIKPCRDPRDMFFAEVKLSEQEMKETMMTSDD